MSESEPANGWQRQVLQIIPCTPGWKVGIHPDNTDEVWEHDVACWALVSERESADGPTRSTVVPMVAGDFGQLQCADEFEQDIIIISPGNAVTWTDDAFQMHPTCVVH